ncbi:MAG: helix-turn-helix domain-containing protein [Patescibacteria group bacterium]
MLKNILQKIGLSDKDADIYLACLELGTQPASVIAKKATLKRPTTYLILEGLVRRGLVSEYTGSNVKYFTAVSPEYLLNFVEKQRRELTAHQRELEEYLPQLQSLSNPYSLSPKVRFFEGMEGVERVMEDTLTTEKTEILTFSSLDRWFAREDLREFIARYGQQRSMEKKIPLRGIVIDTPLARKYIEQDYPGDSLITQTRWFPQNISTFHNEINIYENKVAICSLGRHELIGLIIESQEIADSQRSIFEMCWNNAMLSIPQKKV